MIKNNPLNDIIECDIDISNPSSNNVAFENILIIVPGPQGSGKKKMEKVTAISKADELLDYGFVVSETAYVAASVAFSQNPSPSLRFLKIPLRLRFSFASEKQIRSYQIPEHTKTLKKHLQGQMMKRNFTVCI